MDKKRVRLNLSEKERKNQIINIKVQIKNDDIKILITKITTVVTIKENNKI